MSASAPVLSARRACRGAAYLVQRLHGREPLVGPVQRAVGGDQQRRGVRKRPRMRHARLAVRGASRCSRSRGSPPLAAARPTDATGSAWRGGGSAGQGRFCRRGLALETPALGRVAACVSARRNRPRATSARQRLCTSRASQLRASSRGVGPVARWRGRTRASAPPRCSLPRTTPAPSRLPPPAFAGWACEAAGRRKDGQAQARRGGGLLTSARRAVAPRRGARGAPLGLASSIAETAKRGPGSRATRASHFSPIVRRAPPVSPVRSDAGSLRSSAAPLAAAPACKRLPNAIS